MNAQPGTSSSTAAPPVVSYHLPDIVCSFPWKLNDNYGEDVEREVFDWSSDLFADYPHVKQRLEHVRRCNYMLWLCMLFPDIDRQVISPWGKFTTSFTLLDDASELSRMDGAEPGAWWTAPFRLIRDGLELITSTGYSDAAQAVREAKFPNVVRETLLVIAELRSTMSPQGGEDFLRELAAVAEGILSEDDIITADRAQGLDMDVYMDIRIKTYGLQIYAAGVPDQNRQAVLDIQELDDPCLLSLRRLACAYSALANELYSFRKEYVDNADRISSMVHLLPILVYGHGLTWQQAVDQGVEMLYETEREYLRIRDTWFANGCSSAVREMCQRLEWMMAGNLHYMKVTPRYHGSYFTGKFHGGLVVCDPADRGEFHPDSRKHSR